MNSTNTATATNAAAALVTVKFVHHNTFHKWLDYELPVLVWI